MHPSLNRTFAPGEKQTVFDLREASIYNGAQSFALSEENGPLFLPAGPRRPGKRMLLLLPLVILALLTILLSAGPRAKPVLAEENGFCLVIDPGHGGRDAGAVSIGGDKESEINLAIGLRLEKLAELCGLPVVLTRRDDSGADPQARENYSERRELEVRTEIINSVPNAMLLSVHQNFYPTSGPKGAQVLYAEGEESAAWGKLTHDNLVSCLDPENRRVAAPAPKALYITSHVNCPALLVECGFLSNFSDREKLITGSYQTALSVVLLASCLRYNEYRMGKTI